MCCHTHRNSGNPSERNCTTFIAGRTASATGRVLVAHNEDDEGYLVVRHGYVPAADWPEGTFLPAEPGRAAIPQVRHTYGYDWSEYIGKDGGLGNADAFYNECGVCITSNSCTASREDLNDASRVTDGGMAFNLRRVLAERAGSAREGLKILIDMVETWGYAPSGRAYTVADKDEAFMMQIVSGKHYCAARVPDDHVVIMPNHYTFHSLHEYDEMYYSADIVDYAVEKGWYNPETDGEFDFARAYQAPKDWLRPSNRLRGKHALRFFGVEWDGKGMPFSIKVDRKITREDFISLLSMHYEGDADDIRFGPGHSPHDTDNVRVCSIDTVESFVCELHDVPQLTTMWFALGRPCLVPFIPLHPLSGLPEALVTLKDPAQAMATHTRPNLEAIAYQDTLWQCFRDFCGMMEMVYSDTIGEVTEMKKKLHARFVQENDRAVSEAEALRAEGKSVAALFRAMDSRHLCEAETALDSIRIRRGKILNEQPIMLRKGDTVRILFTIDGLPDRESLVLTPCRFFNHGQYSTALSLTDLGNNTYAAEFSADPQIEYGAPGIHEHFLGGIDASGKSFAAMLLTNTIE